MQAGQKLTNISFHYREQENEFLESRLDKRSLKYLEQTDAMKSEDLNTFWDEAGRVCSDVRRWG